MKFFFALVVALLLTPAHAQVLVPQGNIGITALTGDVTASGPGSAAASLAWISRSAGQTFNIGAGGTYGTFLPVVAATLSTDQGQASGGTKLLAFAATTGAVVGQTVTGTNVTPGTQVASIVSNAQVSRAATGTTTSSGTLVDFSSTTGFAVGQQCTDTTAPTSIGAGNVILSIQAGVSITLTSNLVGTVTSGDTIVCDPVVTLTQASTGTIAAAASIQFVTNNTSFNASSSVYSEGDLSVVGNINTAALGTAALPAITLGSVPTGFYAIGTTALGISVNGSDVLDYGQSNSTTWTFKQGVNFGNQSLANIFKITYATGGGTLATPNVTTTTASNIILAPGTATTGTAGSVDITAGAASGSAGVGGSVVVTMGTATGGGGAVAGTLQFVNLGSAALGTAYLCWNVTGNIVSEDTTCTASARDAKNPLNTISGREALLAVSQLPDGVPVWTYKDDEVERVHAGLYADDIAPLMAHCGLYEHGKLHGYEDHCVIGFALAALRELTNEFSEYRRGHP